MAEQPLGSYELIVLMGLAFRSMIDDLQARLGGAGFSDVRPGHGFAFQLLSFKSASINELAEHLGVTKQAASQMVEYLEQRHYVIRQSDPDDKRSKVVTLTAKGWACIKMAEDILADMEKQLTGQLEPVTIGELRNILRSLVYQRQGEEILRLRPIW